MKRQLLSSAATLAVLAILAPLAAGAQEAPTAGLAPVSSTVSDAQSTPPASQPEDVIVTGTRQLGRTKQQSPAPVDVISAKELAATGQQNVFDALDKLLPSLDLPPQGFDIAGLVRSARLRGLSPDDTLVLVDGKRRHDSAYINALTGPVGGSDPVDLDMIPISLIDHIEVLRDGAAAQYGSDAIAGVINIILKHANHGGDAFAQEGATYVQDGFTNNLGTSQAFSLGENGFFDLAEDYRYHDHTLRSGNYPQSTSTVANSQLPGLGLAPVKIPQDVSHIEGDPRYNLVNLGYNTAYTISPALTVYSFGTYSYRHSAAFENFRDPNTSGAYPTVIGVYPNGFEPQEVINEDDYSETLGVKGDLQGDWHYDLSTTYGGDIMNFGLIESVNSSLLAATGSSPTHFHDGEYNDTEWTSNLDISRQFDLGFLAKPLSVAVGGEFRRNTYEIQQGDSAAQYGGGPQAFGAVTPLDSGYYQRTNEAVYGDVATYITSQWQVDIAGRFEHYSDFGNTETGKVTSRYDVTPWFAVRGTISNGFRAPTLAQEGFTTVNVGPVTASGQFPVNSAAARALGSRPLKPERSQNYEVGFVVTPMESMHLAVDAYQIGLRDQIVDSGLFTGDAAAAALALSGLLPPTCSGGGCNVSAQYFTNGVNTRTRGVDITADYLTHLGGYGRIAWVASANINDVELTRVDSTVNFTPDVLSELTRDTPKTKIILQATWTLEPFSFMARATRYGEVDEVLADGNSGSYPFTSNRNKPAWIGDVELGYNITENLKFTLGADNFTDKYASHTTAGSRYHNAVIYIPSSPYGIDGGLYYGRLNFNWGAPPKPVAEMPVPPPPAAPAPTPARTYLVFFDWDRADLTERARQIVASAAEASTHVQTTRISVNGYTDLSGTAAYNQKLSVRRAEAVEKELIHDGIARSEIFIHGYGETHPLVQTAQGVREPQNRRVEIILM
jgi:iron complex outermembrane receptor protein